MKRRLKITFTKVKRTNAPTTGAEPHAPPTELISVEELEELRRIGMRHLDGARQGKPLPKKDE